MSNEHVAGIKGNECIIVIDENKKIKGKVVWSDSELDMAIIKVNCKFNNYATIGNSEELKLAEPVYAIGNPISIDFKRSVSSGIISGFNRKLEFEENGEKLYITNLIQTDATINEGNSGGALVNELGELVGINTIKISSAESMNFAIPINIVEPVLEKLKKYGEFKEHNLGITCYDKFTINYDINKNFIDGVLVTQVNPNSNAELAGIKVGDIILSVNEEHVDTVYNFKKIVYGCDVGSVVKLKVKRDISYFEINVKI